MTKVLWTVLGAVVAVNVVVLTGAAISLILERRRHRTEIRYLEAIWRGERPFIPGRLQTAAPGMPHRTSGRKLAGVVTTVAVLCAGTAMANPDARHAVVSVLGTVAQGLQLGSSDPLTSAAGRGLPASIDPTWRTSDPPGAASAAEEEPRPVGPSEIAVEPMPDPTPAAVDIKPATPTTISAVQASAGTVVLSWNDVANETGYRVERSGDGVGGWDTVTILRGADVTTIGDGGLTAGTYYYRVSASNAGGDSAPSDVASVTVVDPPTPPTATATAVSANEILLTWLDVANESGYQIERSSDGETGWIQIATTGQGITEYIDAGLTAGTRYHYRVVAVNAAGASSPSDVVSADTYTSAPSGTDSAPSGTEIVDP